MGFENTTTIAGLNELWPLGTDPRSEGDDHLREIKKVLKTEFPKGGVTKTAEMRSRIVNGAMQVGQENGNTAGTAAGYFGADQWATMASHGGTMTTQRVQSVTPNGSVNRYRVTVTVADAALAAGDYLGVMQRIEGIKVADFRYGSASAKPAVLRFGWKSPAGTYSASIRNSAANRSYIAPFTVAAGQANTDTEQVIVIAGDATGTWLTDTGVGMDVMVVLAAGTTFQGVAGWQAGSVFGTATNTNGMATAGNVFELFDVSLHLDANATGLAPPWSMPDEAQELQACKRYYQKTTCLFYGFTAAAGLGYWGGGSIPVTMRSTPLFSGTNSGSASFPATVGTFTQIAENGFYEQRVSNAAANAAYFMTVVTCNARM